MLYIDPIQDDYTPPLVLKKNSLKLAIKNPGGHSELPKQISKNDRSRDALKYLYTF